MYNYKIKTHQNRGFDCNIKIIYDKKMAMSDFFQGTGYLAYSGSFTDLSIHKHNALQITLGFESLTVETKSELVTASGVILTPNTSHKISCKNGFILLVEAESHLSKDIIGKYIDKTNMTTIPERLVDQAKVLVSSSVESDIAASILSLFIPDFCIKRHFESRVQNVLNWIDLKEKAGSWDEIALNEALNIACLSKSRFLHLFSMETGIPWRPYLLWRRLLSAINFVFKGCSMTESALNAGFSDSAHLSRAFRSTFGMSPSQAYNNLKE